MSSVIRTALGILAALSCAASAQTPAPDRTVRDVAAHLSKVSGMPIYVESRLAREKIPNISTASEISAEKLQELLESLLKSMPKGAGWAKIYLPPPPKGKTWNPDDVVEYARAQARLYGTVGEVQAGSIEILSSKLSPEQAGPVIEALNLKPVYVLFMGRGGFEGTWQTSFGEMRLKVLGTKVTGTYTTGDGVIEGTLRGNVLRGRWFERGPGRGGDFEFVLSEEGESFSGRWTNDGSESISTWIGTRVSRK